MGINVNIPKPTYTKSDVGLGNVDNTSDVNKPISSATQTAVDGKVDKVTGKELSENDFTDALKLTYDDASAWVTDVGIDLASRTTNTNTGDETQSSILSKLGFFHLNVTPSSVLTGTTTPTQLGVIVIPPNSINSNDALKIYTPLVKSGALGTCTIVYKLSTSSTMPSGTTGRIATFTSGSNNTFMPMQRNPVYNGGNLTCINAGVSLVTDVIVGLSVPTIVSVDRTVTQYLYIEVTLGNGGDSVYLAGGHVTNI